MNPSLDRGPAAQRGVARPDGGCLTSQRVLCPEGAPQLRAQCVDLARIMVQTVHDLPQRGQGLHRVSLRERRELVSLLAEHSLQAPVALHQGLFRLVQLRAHVCLRSSSVPITMRSSSTRFAFSSNRGRDPMSTSFTPNRRPSCASASAVESAERIFSDSGSSAGTPGSSTRISISSRIPSAVYRWIWNSSISENSRMI